MKTEIMSLCMYTCFLSILLMQTFSTVSAVETTTVLPSLTNSTEATTMKTTSTAPTEATKFTGQHDSNAPTIALKEVDTTIPNTTVKEMDTTNPTTTVPYTTGFSTVKAMQNSKVTSTVTCATSSNVTKIPTNQHTICYPAVTSKTTDNDEASTNAVRTLENTPDTSFIDLTLRKKGLEEAGISLSDQANDTYATDPIPQVKKTIASPKVTNNTNLVIVTTHATFLLTNATVPSNTTARLQSSSTTNVKGVLAQEQKRKPFTKYFQQFLLWLSQLDLDKCTNFAFAFARRLISLVESENLQQLGPTITRFLYYGSQEVLKKPKYFIKWLMRRGYRQMLHRRDVLTTEMNSLLDLIDIVYIPQEEEAMEGILNDTLVFPKNNKTVFDIVEDILRKVILMPSWRLKLSKDPNWQTIIQYINDMIKWYRGRVPFRRSGNTFKEKNITQLKDMLIKEYSKTFTNIVDNTLASEYSKEKDSLERHLNKSSLNKIHKKEVTNKMRDIGLEAEEGHVQTKYKHSSTTVTESIFKYYKDVPAEAYWNANRSRKIIKENKSSSMRNKNKYQKSKFKELYKKYKHNKKVNKSPHMRQRVTFMGYNGEFSPFNLNPAPPKDKAATMAAFNNGFMTVLNRQKNLYKDFDSRMVLPLTSVTRIDQPYLTPIVFSSQRNIERDFNFQMMTVLPVQFTTEIPQLYLTRTVFTKRFQNQVSKTIQRFGDNIEVHKYIVTKTPNYLRMQPATIGNTPEYTEFISFEINNLSNIVDISMKLQFKKTESPQQQRQTSVKPSVNFLTNKAVTNLVPTYSQPTVSVVSRKNETRIWDPYKMDKYLEISKFATSIDPRQKMMLRMKPTVEVGKDMTMFGSRIAYTLAKGLEIPVLGDVKYTETTRKHDNDYQHVYRMKKDHAMRKRDKHKHKMHKHGRRESLKRHFLKQKYDKKRFKHKLRDYKRHRYLIKRYNHINKYGRKNDKDIWDYYWKRAKEPDQSDIGGSVYSSYDSVQDENGITKNGDHYFSRKMSTAGHRPPYKDGHNTKKDLEIIWYEKDKSKVSQSTILQYFKPSKGNKMYKKISNHSRIKEYKDVIKTFSERIQNIKLSTRIKSNEIKIKDYVTKLQQKSTKYSSNKKKHLKNVKLQTTLLADIDKIQQQVGKGIEYNADQYSKRKKQLKKLPSIAKTPTSLKDRSTKSSNHVINQGNMATNLYINHFRVPKNLIDVRRYLEDLRRHPQDAKKALKFSKVNLLVDSVYSDEEKELKNNLYDAFRHEDRKYFRRNLDHDSTPERGLREDSEYTDTEVVLKQKIYKSINMYNRQNRTTLL